MKHALVGHEATTVAEMGWQGILNGKLLSLAAAQFDVFLTVDKNLQFQQNLESLPLPLLAIHSPSLRWDDVEKYIGDILDIMNSSLLPKIYIIE